MPNGVDLDIYHPDYPEEDIEKCKSKYHIEREYLLYQGTLEPRKNLVNLVKAYGLVKKDLKNQAPKLVLAGGKGWYYDSIFETVEQLNLKEDVIFTGYVPEEEVPLLMNGAKAFVFPSLYEGFGMPPLEAMACGTPVIVSNTSSLPEVVGNAGMLVDFQNIKSASMSMKSLNEDLESQEKLKKSGVKRAIQYSWKNSGNQLSQEINKMRMKL